MTPLLSVPPEPTTRNEESLWACFGCGRAQRMAHSATFTDDQAYALAAHQHAVRQSGKGSRIASRCPSSRANIRITRHVEGTRLVGFETHAVPQVGT